MDESIAAFQKAMGVQDDRNRLRVFWVPERDMIPLLQMYDRLPEYLMCPQLQPLPKDAEIVRCWHEPRRAAFGFLVQHSSFGIVPPGEMAPDGEPATMEAITVRCRPYPDEMLIHQKTNIASMSRDELLKVRDEINTRIYDLERQPSNWGGPCNPRQDIERATELVMNQVGSDTGIVI